MSEIIIMTPQKCSMCGKVQMYEEFYGLRNRRVKTCKTCRRKYSRRCEHGKHKHACKECGTYKYIPKSKRDKTNVKDLVDKYEKMK